MVQIQHFKVLFIFNIYSFIFNICIHLASLFVQNSTLISIFNSSICSQNYYPFNYFLFIQELLRISLTHGSDVLPAADEQGAAKKRERSLELWKDTDRFCTVFSEERLRRSEHLRLFLITLRRCSIDFLQIFFRELQTREKCKEVLHTIRKINGVINPPMGKGVPVLLLFVESFYFKLIFSCVLALKLDKERVMDGVITMPPPMD